MKLLFLFLTIIIAGCVVQPVPDKSIHAPAPAPAPVKPVCPKGIKQDWCRPLAVGEMGTTVLGNQYED
jgi:hypothetical protein